MRLDKPTHVLFKGGKYRSDAEVPAVIPITDSTARHRLPPKGERKAVIVVQVRRAGSYHRTYLRGVARFIVTRYCQCCSSLKVSGEFVRNGVQREQ